MNIGTIITRALNRAKLSVSDSGFRDMANEILDENIQDLWNKEFWKFRKKALTLTTAADTEEYSLDKRARIVNIVPNTMRGTDPVRRLDYEPSHAFYKRRPYSLEGSDPYYFRDGSFQGYATNPSVASTISFTSSLTNYTTGTVSVVRGQTRVVITTGVVSVDKIGQWIRVGSDTKAYRITKIEHNSTSIFYLNEPYQGADSATASFTMGDIAQKVTVLGYVSSQLQEEEIQLNGSTAAVSSKSFTSLVRISKSDKTHGYVTATSNSGAVTNAVLDPGDNDLDIQTVKLYPIPTKTETINYECYIQHPHLYKYSDSPLFPNEFHQLLVLDLYIRLQEEWNEKEVPQTVLERRNTMLQELIYLNNNTDAWTIQKDSYEDSERARLTNLPSTYEEDGSF